MKSVEKSLRKFIDEWGFDQGKQLNNFKFDNEAMILFAESFAESQNKELIEEVQRLKLIIENGLGPKDLENDISPMHEI